MSLPNGLAGGLAGRLGRGLAGRQSGGAAAPFTPANLLGGAHRGAWFSMRAGQVYKDAAKTMLAASGEIARAVVPMAGTFGDATAASDAEAPTFTVSGDLSFAQYDGSADFLQATDASFVLNNSAYMCIGITRGTNTGTSSNVHLRASTGPNDYFDVFCQTSGRVQARIRALSLTLAQTTVLSGTNTFLPSTTYVYEAMIGGLAGNLAQTINAASGGTAANNWDNSVQLTGATLFMPNNATDPETRHYDVFLRNTTPTVEERAVLRQFIAARAGVSLP